MKSKSVADTVLPWLRANLGSSCCAPLTGTDVRALKAAVQILELFSSDHDDRVLKAFGIVVAKMQPSTQELAYHAIAHVLEWQHRDRIWNEVLHLPKLENIRRCQYEPQP